MLLPFSKSDSNSSMSSKIIYALCEGLWSSIIYNSSWFDAKPLVLESLVVDSIFF